MRGGELPLGHHIQRAADEELAGFRPFQRLRQQIGHLVDLRKALQDGDEAAMLPLRRLHLDDVVVEVVALVSRRHGAQLGTGGMDEDSLEEADLGGDVEGECHRVGKVSWAKA